MPRSPAPPRRGLSREEAADHCGFGVELFDRCCEEGVMPQPRRIGDKRIWDIEEIDAAFDALPHWTADDRKRGIRASNDDAPAQLSERERWLAEAK